MRYTRAQNPAPFRGSRKTKCYFEGWYLRLSAANDPWNFALIPGISIGPDGKAVSFLQFIESEGTSHYIPFGFDEFYASDQSMDIRIGRQRINRHSISIDLRERGLDLIAELEPEESAGFGDQDHSLNVMGWASKVPKLPCYHHIIHMSCKLRGKVIWKDEIFDFSGGTAYMEKDWGSTFPEKWSWMQSSKFDNVSGALSAVVSGIQLGPLYIPAGVAAFQLDDRRYLWSSASGHLFRSRIGDGIADLRFYNGRHQLKLEAQAGRSAPLIAPAQGEMNRVIRESMDSSVSVTLSDYRGKTVYKGFALNAGLELVH